VRDALLAWLEHNMWCQVTEHTAKRLVIRYGYDSGD